jgi:diphthamide biosynthesis enzyme Dph1/Dph2-like protein
LSIAFFHDAAGYLHIIEQMKELIRAAGKKSYTLVMGRPNSAKLANFPEVCYFNSDLFSVSLFIYFI